MLKLYGGKISRATIVQWYLEELGVPYEFVLLDMQAGEHRQPEFLAINPMGKVPAIVDGDFTLWESGAILLYLAEKYGKLPTSVEEKSVFYQWVLFGNSSLATGLFVEANREKETPKLLSALETILANKSYLVGDEFTVADVAVGSVLTFAQFMLKMNFNEYPAVAEYAKRMMERPVFAKVMGQPNPTN
ncbi:glutathione S-transferase family protein [Crocosphaera sp. XPORK-15E]|uniref:glutathione S-transferase family protein n=1 Tax=Crocosphaera sp. XPORK-15E TaxID=3110247 RepID=UPI002B1FB4D9|nr:glutathione S-transferase family protein [Crocosphaera sp. XPORK-15E]MEA5535418.1 glutathione S-transferase family protein [Crocosphaera sp. XPORK-15E]